MIKLIITIMAITILITGCAVSQPNPEHRNITMTIDGNVQEVVVVREHPCEGNWNFCDHVLAQEKLIVPGEYDDYGSYMYPEF